MQKKREIGLLGGSFDPIHKGHLHLAHNFIEKMGLQEIIFCPAYCSPHKETTPPLASYKDRWKMVELAIRNCPAFSLYTPLGQERTPTYTIDIVKELYQGKYRDSQLYTLIGEDLVKNIDTWKDAELLFSLAPLIIAERFSSEKKEEFSKNLFYVMHAKKMKFDPLPISSTQVRSFIGEGKPIGDLLPSCVAKYIEESKLYKDAKGEE